MVWYQMFEYAVGHWLQKATEHMIGCVLCSPGCFSLFRGKALMDDNVMKKYTLRSDEARHYVQYDQGTFLSDLILQPHILYLLSDNHRTKFLFVFRGGPLALYIAAPARLPSRVLSRLRCLHTLSRRFQRVLQPTSSLGAFHYSQHYGLARRL